LKFVNSEIGLSIEIQNGLVNMIQQVGLAHYPKEFGGILIGQYTDDKLTVNITDTILPSKYYSSPVSFDRGAEGLEEKLLALFTAEPSKIYVGEWHTHPNAAPYPSGTDIRALQQIVTADSVNIYNPVMLIVGLTQTKVELGFYVYLNNQVHRYVLETESIGNGTLENKPKSF
jgi:integrative and conjugative element protein (TIGR02256 family)